MKKMVVTVTDYGLLRAVIDDACVDANTRALNAKKNNSTHAHGLEVMATALQKLRGEVERAHEFK